MRPIDWQKVYGLAKDFGVPLLTFGLGMLVEHIRTRRQEGKADQRHHEQSQAGAATAREERITRVLDAYVKGTRGSIISGEDGALTAGVLELADWTEMRDFCKRASQRAIRPGDEPIPAVRRHRIRDEQLPAYFQRWRTARSEPGEHVDVEQLIANLP